MATTTTSLSFLAECAARPFPDQVRGSRWDAICPTRDVILGELKACVCVCSEERWREMKSAGEKDQLSLAGEVLFL